MFTNRIAKSLAILLMTVVFLGTASFATRSSILPKADRSYDSLEQSRAFRSLASTSNAANYDQIETVRIQRSSLAIYADYDAIEQLRNGRGMSADRSYDSLEALRLGR